MQKRVIGLEREVPEPDWTGWLDLQDAAAVEVSSEDAAHPVESALLPGNEGVWRAADAGPQTIRIVFNKPQRISRVRLKFTETAAERTQEFVLRWGKDQHDQLRDIVRQRWNFSPQGSTSETEDYRVNLEGVGVLELVLNPDIQGGRAVASLDELRVG